MRRNLALLLLPAATFAQDADVACRKAVELHQAGDIRTAASQYEACLAARPDAPRLRSNYGAVLSALGRYQEAIAQYEQSLKATPGDPRLRLNLALAYYKSGAIPKAAEAFQQLHEEQPQLLQITLLLADCRLQLGEMQTVIQLLSPIEAEQKENLAFAYMLGMALIRSGQLERGQAVVDRILRDGTSAEAHLLIAHAAFTKRDYPNAAVEFRKALEVKPDLTGAQSFYGQSLLFTGDADGAQQAFRNALAANPTDYEATVKLGAILSVRKQYKEALPLLERASLLRPDALEPHAELAAVYRALSRTSEASLEEAKVKALGGSIESRAPSTGLLAVGTKAPVFVLPTPNGPGTVDLRSLLANGPVALVFGSYTCPKFRGDAAALNRLAEKYKGRIQFVLVYIHEAHANGTWQSTINERDKVELPDAKSLDQKKEYALSCTRKLSIPYSVVVDPMDRQMEEKYAAWPSAVYLIGRSGKIVWTSRLGEQDFDAIRMEAALQESNR